MVCTDNQGGHRTRNSPRNQVRTLKAPRDALWQRVRRERSQILPHRRIRRDSLAHDLQILRKNAHSRTRQAFL